MDDPTSLLRVLLPKTPLILKTAFLHSLSLSSTASKCDLKTALTVSVLRSLLNTPSPMRKQQYMSCKDPGIKGGMWISKATFAIDNGSEVKEALVRAIDGLKGSGSTLNYTVPDLTPVEVEWTGHRSNVDARTPLPSISESEKYTKLMEEVKSPVTVLYLHGGAYCVCDPSSHRDTTARLAKLTSGIICSIRYRLAPQDPFPSALLDAFVAYLSLISPPPGSLHKAVNPSNIVFAGDSAGGNLALVLLQTLLELRRQNADASINFHGQTIPLQLPAGLALNSPWCDVSRSLPSTRTNQPFDYLPTSYDDPTRSDALVIKDDLWPSTPPRVDIFAAASMLDHPLVSPVVLPAEKWKGAPPVYLCLGQELLADEIRVTARRIHAAGSTVLVEAYEGMPHCFAMMLPGHPTGRRCFESWAGFISKAVTEKESLSSRVSSLNPVKGMKEEELSFEALTGLEDGHVFELIKNRVALKVQMERDLQKGAENSLTEDWTAGLGQADADAEQEMKTKARL